MVGGIEGTVMIKGKENRSVGDSYKHFMNWASMTSPWSVHGEVSCTVGKMTDASDWEQTCNQQLFVECEANSFPEKVKPTPVCKTWKSTTVCWS